MGGASKTLNEQPGPGSYQTINDLGGPRYGFGSSKREKGKAKNLGTPGPGAYENPQKSVGEGPSVSMKFRP